MIKYVALSLCTVSYNLNSHFYVHAHFILKHSFDGVKEETDEMTEGEDENRKL